LTVRPRSSRTSGAAHAGGAGRSGGDLEPDFQTLIDDMPETMHAAEGIGLAAPQLGMGAQLWSTSWRSRAAGAGQPMVEPGPASWSTTGRAACRFPTCAARAAAPGGARARPRSPGKPVSYRAEGLEARVIQHEFDHLNAVVFLDRMRDLQSLSYLAELDEYVLGEADEEPGAVG
jgi:peptide deformylase